MDILLVEDDHDSRVRIARFLRDLGHRLVECENGEDALKTYRPSFRLVLSDIKMPKMSGIDLMRAITARPEGQDVDIVLLTGRNDLGLAIEALGAGAYGYLLKPINITEMAALIERVADHQSLLRENRILKENFEDKVRAAAAETREELKRLREACAETAGIGKIGAFSGIMKEILRQAHTFHTDRSVPILIQGEAGTGKDVVARYIHYSDLHVTTPFVDINCAALAPGVFESELFGCEAGAFTGGLPGGKKGKLDMAVGGTIFFDEITELPIDLQAKLLRVIQEKEFYRVGGIKKVKADVRIICATIVDIEKKAEQGVFRRDLLYRLNMGRLFIPPLRERTGEILPLAGMFLNQFALKRGKRFCSISDSAAGLLLSYSWPGNIRELKNSLEMVVLIHDDTELRPEHLEILPQFRSKSLHSENSPFSDPEGFALPAKPFNLEKHLNKILLKVLEMHNGNKTRAALYLGISRRTLYRRLKAAEKDLRSLFT